VLLHTFQLLNQGNGDNESYIVLCLKYPTHFDKVVLVTVKSLNILPDIYDIIV